MSDLENVTMNSTANGTSSAIDENEIVFNLGIIDGVIVLIYITVSVSLGVYLGRKHKTAEDYFLAGRSMKWPFVGLSLFATNVSSASLVGLAGTAYDTGISVFNYVWMANVILIIFSAVFLPAILQSKIHTMPEMLEIRYSTTCRYYFSVLSIILNIIADTGTALYGGSLVVKMIFPQLEIWHTVTILAIVAGIYTISGGLMAVIYTDTLQGVTLIIGSILVSIFAFMEIGGWTTVIEQIPAERLSLIRPVDDSTVPWTGVVFGIPILGFYYWCTNQSITQRILSSKSVDHGRWGAIFSGIFNLPLLFIMVLPGTVASILFPGLPKPDMVYPKLLFTLLPVGVLGVVLAGFIAALLSNIDSNLNSASTLITMDFVKKFKPSLTPSQLMKIGKLVTFLIMVASVCWAPQIERFGSLYQYFQKLVSYLIPPVVALYIVGFFWKGANARGAIVTLIIGNILSVAVFVMNEVYGLLGIHFLHIAPILLCVSVLLLIGVSLSDQKPCTEDQLQLIWSYKHFREDVFAIKGQPIWKNFYLHSTILLILTVVIVGFFW